MIKLLTIDTDDRNVLQHAMDGDIITGGCSIIAQHLLEDSHDASYRFTKWFVEPGTGRFCLLPEGKVLHTITTIS